MSPPRKRFLRPLGKRPYRRLFVIAVEGRVTEPQYFRMLNSEQVVIKVLCGTKQCSPLQVLTRLQAYLRKEPLKASDEAWVVIDKDNWTDAEFDQINAWSKRSAKHGFALSNPKFEYWLILHFEDAKGLTTPAECSQRIKKHLPGYHKRVDKTKFPLESIRRAIQRAKSRDKPPCVDWPRTVGSTVYRLVERIFSATDT